jgi:SAM-dependent methyltransferase
MHQQVLTFLRSIKDKYPQCFSADGDEMLSVLECGSYNINGSPRQFFDGNLEYIGIDHRAGPDVDAVSLVHEYTDKPDGYFDTVISTEMLEHDPFWAASLERMVALTKPGGSMILTVAAPGRPAHEVDCAPKDGYYRTLQDHEILAVVQSVAAFGHVDVQSNRQRYDFYLFFQGKQDYAGD